MLSVADGVDNIVAVHEKTLSSDDEIFYFREDVFQRHSRLKLSVEPTNGR
jgi:hypothetical protein